MIGERLNGAPAVVAALIALSLGITAYLNLSPAHREAERRTVLHRQFILDDRDGDGALDRAEAAAAFGREFAGFDGDGDGMLSRDEFIGLRPDWAKYHVTERWKAIQAVREALFAEVDQNRDLRATVEEYVEHALAGTFTKMDKDGDRKVTRAEFFAGQGL